MIFFDKYPSLVNKESVYNPVSLANFFINNGEFNNYWFATGTPTFLMELMIKKRLDLEQAALSQIREKEYFKPFLLSPKKITLAGVNFDTETGRLSGWQSEEIIR